MNNPANRHHIASLSFLLCVTLFTLIPLRSALAQDLAPKAPPQKYPVTIYNATIHTISGPTIEKGFITFSDGVIREIGEGNPHIPAPSTDAGKGFFDAKGKHVFPGMIAAETQLGLQEFGLIQQTNDHSELGSVKPEVLAATAVNPDSTLIPVTRTNGILTAGVFPDGGLIPGRASAIRLDAWTVEELPIAPSSLPVAGKAAPRAFSDSSIGLVVNWPQARTIRAWWMDRSEDEQLRGIREAREQLATIFDTAAAYAAARAADPSLPTDQRWEAIRPVFAPSQREGPGVGSSSSSAPSHREGDGGGFASSQLPLFIFANDSDQIAAAVAFCAERHLRMVLVGGREAPECAALLKAHDIPVIVSGTHVMPRRADSPYDEGYTLPARLHAAGVHFCIASADRTAHERNLPYNAAMAAAHGLPMDAALASVTLWPAQILGLGDQLGSLEPGKHAPLLLTDGNPLDVTTRIDSAYIDGRLIDLSNKQIKLYEKYRERYKQMGQIK